jgi:hypothetical protein
MCGPEVVRPIDSLDDRRHAAIMRGSPRLIPVLLVILACGPGSAGTTDATTITSTTGTTTGSITDADPPTGTGAPVTTDEPTTDGTPSTSTTDPGATTSTTSTTGPGTATEPDPGATTDGDTDEPGFVEVAAIFVPGGLDRIVVRKADHDADLCTSVVFVWPMDKPDPDFMLPLDWGFQNAEIAQGAADCLMFMGPLADAVAAQTSIGWGDWPAQPVCPGMLDIEMAFVFPQMFPWVPPQTVIHGADLPIQGC